MVRIPPAVIAFAAATGCTCGDLSIVVYQNGAGETFRGWHVGDTASVFAEAGHVNAGYDIICPRYGSRPAPDYHNPVYPDSFTFQSSHPEIASVTNRGLVTGLLVGQTDITAISAGVLSRPMRVTVSP